MAAVRIALLLAMPMLFAHAVAKEEKGECGDVIPDYRVERNTKYRLGALYKVGPLYDLDACVQSCSDNSECAGFVYSRATHGCYFRSTLLGKAHEEGTDTYQYCGEKERRSPLPSCDKPVRGYFMEPNTEILGNDLAFHSMSVEQCAEKCDEHSECIAFYFFIPWYQCRLKSERTGTIITVQGESYTRCTNSTGPILQIPNYNASVNKILDGSRLGIREGNVGSAAECAALCDDRSECQGFSFLPSQHVCIMKGSDVSMRDFSGSVAYVKIDMCSKHVDGFVQHKDANFSEDDIMMTSSTSLEACAAKCRETEGCVGFTRTKDTGNCFMKEKMKRKESANWADSYKLCEAKK